MIRRLALVPLLLILSLGATCPGATAPAVDPLSITSPTTSADATSALKALDGMQQAAHARALAARTNHALSDAAWGQVVRAENQVQATFGPVTALKGLWDGIGSKPPDFDSALADFRAAVNALVAVSP